jgi:hypothetical protein
VEQYIHIVSAQNNYREGYYSASGSSNYNELEATTSYIEQGELRKFTGDIKGDPAHRDVPAGAGHAVHRVVQG